MLMQNFGATIKKQYGMLWYFLEWPIPGIRYIASGSLFPRNLDYLHVKNSYFRPICMP